VFISIIIWQRANCARNRSANDRWIPAQQPKTPTTIAQMETMITGEESRISLLNNAPKAAPIIIPMSVATATTVFAAL
jgi:hypothetical protein